MVCTRAIALPFVRCDEWPVLFIFDWVPHQSTLLSWCLFQLGGKMWGYLIWSSSNCLHMCEIDFLSIQPKFPRVLKSAVHFVCMHDSVVWKSFYHQNYQQYIKYLNVQQKISRSFSWWNSLKWLLLFLTFPGICSISKLCSISAMYFKLKTI